MSIAILSAKTGNGHISVMKTIEEEFKKQNYYDIYTYPSFYENISFNNKIMSSFYNYLLASSIKLCKEYSEISGTAYSNSLEEYYQESREKILQLVNMDELEAIISTCPFINNNIIRTLKGEGLTEKIPFYIVVTDPFDPIVKGFNVTGATRYFCATEVVKDILVRSCIESSRIQVIDYPVSARFNKEYSDAEKERVYKKMGLHSDKPIILFNSGAFGSMHYFNMLKKMLKYYNEYQIIMICGKNETMYERSYILQEENRQASIKVLGFVDNIEEILLISDIAITKAGANTFYECLYSKTPMIIDGIHGFMYQEQGVIDYLRDYGVGVVLNDSSDLPDLLNYLFSNGLIERIKINIRNLNLQNGTSKIVNTILSDICN